MAEVLSQNEIDALLKALDSGALDVEKVKDSGMRKTRVYDFKRPNKFGKEQIRTLHAVHEHFSRLFSTFLASMLRTFCEVNLISVEEQIFHEFNNSLPDPVILAVFELKPMESSVLMEVPTPICYALIERILGGGGFVSGESREYTEIELALLERVFRHMLRLFREAWAHILPIEPVLVRLETNPRYNEVLSSNETIAIITLRAQIGAADGLLNLCIPHMSIKPYEEKMSSRYRYAAAYSGREAEDTSQEMLLRIQNASVELRAILGETEITARDVLELQAGDVIRLNSRIEAPVAVAVGERIKFKGVPGVSNKHIAIRIESLQEEEWVHE